MILAIDPGNEFSAYVAYDEEHGTPRRFAKLLNSEMLATIDRATDCDRLAVEKIESYGMAVGATVFATCVWTGRFIERWSVRFNRPVVDVPRRSCKLHLCGSARAKDSNVRQALIDRYGPGKDRAIGRKATPGPLYGLTGDCWAALGVAVTVADTGLREERAA